MKPAAARAFAAALALLAGCEKRQDPAAPQPTASVASAVPIAPAVPVMGPERRIVAFGDSLFAGYGLNPGESYPARLEAALRARGINARIVNAGVSGDTTGAALQRLKFTLDAQQTPPELALISLGGNDMLRGMPPGQPRANLEAILSELDRRHIRAVLMGMLAAPNLGPHYARAFDAIYPALAKKHHAALVPFFLQPIIGRAELQQPDHVHPNREGVETIVAGTVNLVSKAIPRAESCADVETSQQAPAPVVCSSQPPTSTLRSFCKPGIM